MKATACADDLWRELDYVLTIKATRQSTLTQLNSLLQKRFPNDDPLTQDNCDLWLESLTTAQLQQCNPGHNDTNALWMTGFVVVFEKAAKRYMFDGTKRLNIWLRDGNVEHHDAIIVRRKVLS